MVKYTELKVDDPLAYVFDRVNLKWISFIISVSAVVATTSVLLVFQLGQPRIWMSMSRDGLLPKKFADVHPKYQTPGFATIMTGFLVAIPSLFIPSSIVTDLTSIGTLFAFVIVCAGVLVLPRIAKGPGKFSLPFINGKFLIPLIAILFIFLSFTRINDAIRNIGGESYEEILFLIFVAILVVTAVFSFTRNLSSIPVIGALCCSYLMIEIPPVSWFWFFLWMATGLIIYFLYGRKKSRLAVSKV
jgi:amino acid transporter